MNTNIKIQIMKFKFMYLIGLAVAAMPLLQSCSSDDDPLQNSYTAVVTVVPMSDNGFELNLTNTEKLIPSNLKTSPFKNKEVRALVNFRYDDETEKSTSRNVTINWIDSIRTKIPVVSAGENNDEKFGNDPIEIVKDWVTIAEDGYLTLRIRTKWGTPSAKHEVNLVSNVNPENPYEFELRHNANGDTYGELGDALIAFNLNGLPKPEESPIKIKINWTSFSGSKSTEFDLTLRGDKSDANYTGINYSNRVQ